MIEISEKWEEDFSHFRREDAQRLVVQKWKRLEKVLMELDDATKSSTCAYCHFYGHCIDCPLVVCNTTSEWYGIHEVLLTLIDRVKKYVKYLDSMEEMKEYGNRRKESKASSRDAYSE